MEPWLTAFLVSAFAGIAMLVLDARGSFGFPSRKATPYRYLSVLLLSAGVAIWFW